MIRAMITMVISMCNKPTMVACVMKPATMNVVVGMHNETVSNVHVYMNHVNVIVFVCMCKI